MPSSKPCPRCKTELRLPEPLPERIGCPSCKAVINLRPKPVAVAAVPLPPKVAPSFASPATVAPSLAPATDVMSVPNHVLMRELARGGLGVVYLAHHVALNDLRAIKRPLALDGLDRDVILARFRREVQAIGPLRSDHVVRAHDAGVDAQGPYLIMEYLEGTSLAELTRRGPLKVTEACELIRQAALGLQAAHEAGLVHRDVKPSNLMLTRRSGSARVVVIDWGLVKRAGEGVSVAGTGPLTAANVGMGTADFMAPEQVTDARAVDVRADVYSLGVTFYVLLTGRPPFAERPLLSKLLAHQSGEAFPPVEAVRKDVPPHVLAILKKMTAHDTKQRHATPGEVAAELGRLARGKESLADVGTMLPPPSALPLPTTDAVSGASAPMATFVPGTASAVSLPSEPMKPQAVFEQTTMSPPQPKSGKGRWVLMALVALMVLIGVGFGVVWALRDKGQDKQVVEKPKQKIEEPEVVNPKEPLFLLKENFEEAYKHKAKGLPKGWTDGEGMMVRQDAAARICLQVSQNDGKLKVVSFRPERPLKGDFFVEVSCYLYAWEQSQLTVRLNARDADPLPIDVDRGLGATIGKNHHAKPPAVTMSDPLAITIVRFGGEITVMINQEPVGREKISSIQEFDSITLGLLGVTKVYSVRVGLGPAPAPILPPTVNKAKDK